MILVKDLDEKLEIQQRYLYIILECNHNVVWIWCRPCRQPGRLQSFIRVLDVDVFGAIRPLKLGNYPLDFDVGKPAALAFMERLKDSGIMVHENTRTWTDFDEFYEIVADFVEHYMQSALSQYYVLTDPDCAVDSAPWNLLMVYQSIMEELGLDGGRGPSLGRFS